MYLEKLHLTNFKSYDAATYLFSERINCIVGENGSGKTNLLDAIYYLSLTKSHFSNQDGLSINHEAEFMVVDGIFVKTGNLISQEERHKEVNLTMESSEWVLEDPKVAFKKSEQITISLPRGQRKVVLHDKKSYERISEHIGRFPVVMVAPNDTDLVREGSEERRRFFDGVLSQLDGDYLQNLLRYNQLLNQRNGLLKQFAERNYLDEDLLDVYSEPLIELAVQLYKQRKNFLIDFLPLFQQHYANLSEGREAVEVIYESEVGIEDFPKEFRRSRQRDVAAQRTTKGAHRDDYTFEIDTYALRKFGSQGQQKSFVIALKLAQFELLSQQKNTRPMLLLDDIFDKLDDRRIQKLIAMMQDGTFGQIFLSDARPERTQQLLANIGVEVRYFETKK